MSGGLEGRSGSLLRYPGVGHDGADEGPVSFAEARAFAVHLRRGHMCARTRARLSLSLSLSLSLCVCACVLGRHRTHSANQAGVQPGSSVLELSVLSPEGVSPPNHIKELRAVSSGCHITVLSAVLRSAWVSPSPCCFGQRQRRTYYDRDPCAVMIWPGGQCKALWCSCAVAVLSRRGWKWWENRGGTGERGMAMGNGFGGGGGSLNRAPE